MATTSRQPTIDVTRRMFLGAGVSAAFGLACGGGNGGSGGAPSDAGTDAGPGSTVFDLYRAMLDAVRKSPDDLPAQADALVAAKDPKAIFEFVRDQIATLPIMAETESIETAVRWGTRATLRCGAGTPRERAELLASLYERAGFKATVVSNYPLLGSPIAAPDAPAKVFARSIARSFQPGPPPGGAASWAAFPGDGAPGLLKPLDPAGTATSALADPIVAALTSDLFQLTPASPAFSGPVPIVQVVLGGVPTLANPLVPGTQLGDGQVQKNPMPAAAATPFPQLKATLSIARASDPLTRIPVATLTVGFDELVGRQLLVQCRSPEPIESALARPIATSSTFAPLLAVMGPGLDPATRNKLSASSAAFTLGGDVVTVDPDGTVRTNGTPIVTGGDPNAASKVAKVTVAASAAAFPRVDLRIGALDAAGKPVLGLAGASIRVADATLPVTSVLRDNGGVNVLLVVDGTSSQPAAFTDMTMRGAVGTQLAQAIFAAFPAARVQVVPMTGGAPTPSGYTLSSAAAVSAAFSSLVFGAPPEDVLDHAARGGASGASLVIFISDGDPAGTDASANDLRARIAAGPPILAVGTALDPTKIYAMQLQQLATLSGGAFVSANDWTNATAVPPAIAAIAAKVIASPYRVSYTAPTAPAGTRAVDVTIGATKGSSSYVAPAQPVAAGGLSGLYLTLQVDSDPPVTRTLGGFSANKVPMGGFALTTSLAADVFGALVGVAMVSFEGTPPPTGVWFDEMLQSRLAFEPMADAALAKDKVAFLKAFGGEAACVSPAFAVGHPRLLPRTDGIVVYERLRAVLHAVKLSPSGGRRMDVLPITSFRSTFAASAKDAYTATLRSSVRVALAEKTMYTSSTASALEGKPLVLLPPLPGPGDIPFVPMAQQAQMLELLGHYSDYGYRAVVAKDGSTLAFWAIDTRTGGVLGVLPDAAGGGEGSPCPLPPNLEDAWEIISLIVSLMDEIPGLSLYAAIGKWTAIQGLRATLAFDDVDAALLGDTNLLGIACEVASGEVGGRLVGMLDLNPFVGAYAGNKAGDKLGMACGGGLMFPACPP